MTRETMPAKTQQSISGLSPLAFFRLLPVANKLFLACTATFAVMNGILFVLSSGYPVSFSKWLIVSEPLTNWVSHVFSSIDAATRFLERANFESLINPIRNALALNFILQLAFPLPIIVASLFDLKADPTIPRRADEIIAKTDRSLSWFVGAFWVIRRLSRCYSFTWAFWDVRGWPISGSTMSFMR